MPKNKSVTLRDFSEIGVCRDRVALLCRDAVDPGGGPELMFIEVARAYITPRELREGASKCRASGLRDVDDSEAR